MRKVSLGASELIVTPICLGTMTFGEQVSEKSAHLILDRAIDCGVNFIDTAEMYSVPAKAKTFGITEKIIGNWIRANPEKRHKIILATKASGPSKNMPWIRDDSLNLTESDIIKSCDNSLRRIKTDRIDLYQIHWPVRSVPAFGRIYFEPTSVNIEYSSIHRQLESLNKLVRAGKIRSVGLSNETPYGVHEFIRIAEEFGLPRIASVQNCYNLVNRSVENALDETLYRLNVSLLAYSPLAFGLLTGKYNHSGLTGAEAPQEGRMKKFEMFRQQRWGRKEALAAARKYSDLARTYGLTPLQLALAFCYTNWRVTSTIIGVTCMDQLEECISAIEIKLSDEILKKIDAIRWKIRDPAQ